ncbi:MAG: hypothetical protein D6775_09415 [Caldilineae bacterium]|nr:MAG: hypothetical protein D6775_09415 [Caldilineae bacterium]
MSYTFPPLSDIHLLLHHNDADGGLAALALRRAIQEESGRVVPLCWADYHTQAINNLNVLAVTTPHLYTIDVRLFPGVPGMDHHDTSRSWYDPACHILDLAAPSCFGLMLDVLDRRDTWPEEIVRYVDWMDAGTYPSVEEAVGLESLGQQFIAIFARLPFERAMAELWQRPDAEAFVAAHHSTLSQIRRDVEILRKDMARRGRLEGRVVVWDSRDVIRDHGIRQGAINPFLLSAVYPQADYVIRIRPDGHMIIGHNPWGNPSEHIGALCETLCDPETGTRGGGKAQVGGAPYTPETLQKALQVLNGRRKAGEQAEGTRH